MDLSTILLHLSLCEGFGPSVMAKIIKTLGADQADQLPNLSVTDLSRKCFLSAAQAQLVVDGLRDRTRLDRELQLLEQHQIMWISYFDQDYPPLLKEIHSPPIGLYLLGSCNALKKESVAIVGSRRAHHYAQQVVNELVGPLVAHDIAIVSGGAIGVDTMAHKETLKVGGATLAVLGSGLLELYPAGNRGMFHTIVQQGGALVSAFPLETVAAAYNFPARNRIIAGLSRATIVVQAAHKSGAKITAQFALEQGRDVFAVPGMFNDPLSVGCHELIREGAILVGKAEDVLEEFGYLPPSRYHDESAQQLDILSKKEVEPEDDVLKHCLVPISFDDLVGKSSYKEHELYDKLFQLQCDGFIGQTPSGLWQKI